MRWSERYVNPHLPIYSFTSHVLITIRCFVCQHVYSCFVEKFICTLRAMFPERSCSVIPDEQHSERQVALQWPLPEAVHRAEAGTRTSSQSWETAFEGKWMGSSGVQFLGDVCGSWVAWLCCEVRTHQGCCVIRSAFREGHAGSCVELFPCKLRCRSFQIVLLTFTGKQFNIYFS